jgi:glycosyltransferase involved in cell wall biosynthesis
VHELIDRSEAEIVHVHNLFPMLSPAVLRAAASDGARVLVTLHNYRFLCLPATFVRDGRVCEDCLGRPIAWPGVLHRCYRGSRSGSATLATSIGLHRGLHTFDRVSSFLAVSRFVRGKYIEAGWSPERIAVKSNFAWDAARRQGPGSHFLYLGRVAPEKGLRMLLDAFRGSAARLLVVGDGPIASELRSAAPANVTFRATVPPPEVPDLIRSARAVVVPSVWYEAQPRTILEAYASGVAVLASDLGALPEVVDDTTGALLPPGDPVGWRAGIERLLDDEEATRLGEGAWRRWRDRYSPERALEDLEAAYAKARS